jgi:hypothetical protein
MADLSVWRHNGDAKMQHVSMLIYLGTHKEKKAGTNNNLQYE